MSFADDFSSVVGSVGETFKNVWTAVNPSGITIPAIQSGKPPATAVGSAIKRQSSTGITAQQIVLTAAAVFLGVALLLIASKRKR